MTWMLSTVAFVLDQYRDEFRECEYCEAVFDPDVNGQHGGVQEDRYGNEREYPTLCASCLDELKAAEYEE